MSANSQVSTLEQPKAGASQLAAKAAAVAKSNGHDVALSGKRVMLTIHPSESVGGDEAVLVGLNSFMYQIPRGEPHDVPEEVASILENAVTVMLSTDKAGGVTERRVPRYAFSVRPISKSAATA